MRKFLQVLLPLKLDWVPYYWTEREDIVLGDRVKVTCVGREYSGVVCSISDTLPTDLPESKVLGIKEKDKGLIGIRPEALAFWKDIADYYLCSQGEVFKTAFPAMKLEWEQKNLRRKQMMMLRLERAEAALAKARQTKTKERWQGEVERLKAEIQSKDYTRLPEDTISLSKAQQKAWSEIRSGKKNVLLHGVTGSGKTEIYTKLAIEQLRKGKNVLYLVPEIALSRQLEERLHGYLGGSLLVFHSHETPTRRGYAAAKVASGSPYVVLGTRSSLFLPHHDLGLIIIDEEHDSSYKQDNPAPRYNGREAAIMLSSHIPDCKVLLGSATPSLESLQNCKLGKFSYVRLDEKYYDACEAEVEIINTIDEKKKRGMVGSFSRKLIERINGVLQEKGQVIILRARRSYSPFVQCTQCGDIPKCPVCNVSMSYHKDKERLVCHHCGHSETYSGKCVKCGGEMAGIGSGTQKIEEEAQKLFHTASIARLDSDVTANPKAEEATIKDFANGKTDILIGTQIVSKGFDFSNLKLVAVIQADSLVAIDDFRADERAYQTLSQLRGRCCRRNSKGLFIIQTSQSQHPVYQRLLSSTSCSQEMMDERKDFGYPPFKRLVNLNILDEYENRAVNLGGMIATRLRGAGLDAIGPFAPQHSLREGGKHLRTIRIALKKDKYLGRNKEIIRKTVADFEVEYKYTGHISIDVDPV